MITRQAKPLFLLGALLCLMGPSFAQDDGPRASQFTPFKGDGYYWYKVDPEDAPKPKEEPPKAVASPAKPASAPPKAFSGQWLKENMPKLLDAAFDNPTTENVKNYMYAQRVLLDRSQNFSNKVKETVATDPFLDENNRVPLDQYAATAFNRAAEKDKSEVLKYLASKGGFWVFTDEPTKCSACQNFVSNIFIRPNDKFGLITQFGFEFKQISVNTAAGKSAAKKLNLTVTPTAVFVVPPDRYYLISQGLMAQDRLVDRLMIAASSADLLPKRYLEMANPYDKGLLDNTQLQAVPQDDNPSKVMNSLRQVILGK